MTNSHLGYRAGFVNQTQFLLLLLCNVCKCSDHSINQFLSFDQSSGAGDSQHRLKERLKPFEEGAVAEIGKAERCFCRGSLAPKPLLLQHLGSEALQRITAGHKEEKQAFLTSFLELFFPFEL